MQTTTIRRGVALSLGIVLALAASSAHAVYEYTSCSHGCTYNAFVRDTYGTVSGFDQIGPIVASLEKGKKGHVLRIEATASVNSHSAGIMDCNVNVNTVTIQGGGLFGIDHGVSCDSAGMCFFTGTYWLDLDAGELAHPGLYINQPLDVVFSCSSYGNSGQRYGATMAVEMVKKR
jgi:hypothetical protein